jgi:hypothetical protein
MRRSKPVNLTARGQLVVEVDTGPGPVRKPEPSLVELVAGHVEAGDRGMVPFDVLEVANRPGQVT